MLANEPTRVILIRHGRPHRAALTRWCGRTDFGLSPLGERQAGRLGRWLRNAGLAACYASPLPRAARTAQIIATRLGLHVELRADLQEIDFGVLDGMKADEIAAEYPDVFRRVMRNPTRVEFPQGESFAQTARRVRRAFREIRTRHRGQTVAVVAHAGTNRILLADALRMPSSELFRLDQSHGAASIVDYFAVTTVVRLINGAPGSTAPLRRARD